MAVTWIDTPGSTLSPDDAIDFVADGAVTFVSVGFGDAHLEEIAYRDGAFVYPYLSSTKTDNTFALRRSGGFPRAPTVHVEGAAANGPAAWGLLYGVDMGTQPPQTFATAGAKSIDGLTWYLKTGSFGTQTCELNASGLRIRAASASQASGSPNNALRWFLPLANVPGFNVNAPIAFWARVSTTGGSGFGLSCHSLAGLCGSGSNGSPLTSLEGPTWISLGAYGQDTSQFGSFRNNAVSHVSHSLSVTAPFACVGMELLSRRGVRRLATLSSAAPADPYTLANGMVAVGEYMDFSASLSTLSTLGFTWTIHNDSSAFQDFYLHNLYIMQPGAGA